MNNVKKGQNSSLIQRIIKCSHAKQALTNINKQYMAYLRSPSWSFGCPTDFRLTHGTPHPITPTLLLKNNLALWAVHCFSTFH